jgi:hypothetical protein
VNASPSTARHRNGREQSRQQNRRQKTKRREKKTKKPRRRDEDEEKKPGGQEMEILQKDKQKEQYLPTKEDPKKRAK